MTTPPRDFEKEANAILRTEMDGGSWTDAVNDIARLLRCEAALQQMVKDCDWSYNHGDRDEYFMTPDYAREALKGT